MIPGFLLAISLLVIPVAELPATLSDGWEAAAAFDSRPDPGRADWKPVAFDAPGAAPGWLRLTVELTRAATERPLALELADWRADDDLTWDGRKIRAIAAPAGEPALLEIPPALSSAGRHVLLVRLGTRSTGARFFARPPRLVALADAVGQRFSRRNPHLVTAVATASFGVLALLFFLRDRSRHDLGLYSVFSLGVSLYLAAPSWRSFGLSAQIAQRLLDLLTVLLPAAGYLFLVRFLRLPFTSPRRVLLSVPLAGALGSLAAPGAGWLPWIQGATLFLLGGELLFALAGEVRRSRSDTGILFLGTAFLLLASLFDAVSGSLVLDRAPVSLVGPAFLVFTAFLLVAVADEGRRLMRRATTDPLTGLLNRHEFLQRARAELSRADRTSGTLALVMLDLDHFKSINDRFGHPAGDRVLTAAARSLSATVRGLDVAGRYGGEEFIVMLVNPAENEVARVVERIRIAIAGLEPPVVPERVTASAGVAIHSGLFERATVADLIRRADAALYESKRGGRDKTTLESRAPATTAAEVRYR